MAKEAPLTPPPGIFVYDLDGWAVWAGRTARDNDYLSVKVTRGNDWWFHVKGMPGSHVLLLVRDGIEPPKSIVEGAAAVAAWHSKQRNGGRVAVSATRGKNVSKPRGAKPGTVEICKEVVLKVQPKIPDASA